MKAYLKRGYMLARGIKFKRERIRQLRELAEHTTSTLGERVSGTPAASRLENCIAQIDAWEREIDADYAELIRIGKVIQQVQDLNQRQLLELRYIDGLKWDEIAEKMSYSRRSVTYLHGAALQSAKKIKPE